MYPLLCVSNLAAARDFYVRHFGFEVAFDADWYVSLKRGPHELAFIRPDHGSIPEGWRKPAAGVLLTVEVEDAPRSTGAWWGRRACRNTGRYKTRSGGSATS